MSEAERIDATIQAVFVGIILAVVFIPMAWCQHREKEDCHARGGALIDGQCVKVEVMP